MMKLRIWIALMSMALLAGCFGGGKKDGGEGGGITSGLPLIGDSLFEDGKPIYFVVEINGERRSYGHRIRRKTEFRGREAILTETVQTTEMIRNSSRFKQVLHRKVITATDGAALYASAVVSSGGQKRTRTVTITGGYAEFQTYGGPEGSKTERVAVPRSVMFGIEPDWLLTQNLRKGETYETTVLDRSARTLVREQATVRAYREEEVLGQKIDVWEVEVRRENGEPTRMTFTRDGDLVRLQADTMLVRMVTKAEAEQDVEKWRVLSEVPTDFPLPAWDNFSKLVYMAEPAANWRKHLRNSEYVKVDDRGSSIEITLLKTAPHLTPVKLPMETPPELDPYLRPAESIRPDLKVIRRQARSVVKNEANALRAVALLAGWVNQHVRFAPRSLKATSPAQTIESRQGDCTEHADLFASLTRSMGIPTRHCLGLLVQHENAVYHTWVEAWIGGEWVSVDTTVSRVGLPAAYLLIARGEGDGRVSSSFAWAIRQGGLALRLVSATKVHSPPTSKRATRFTLKPEVKRTYVAYDGDWLANLFWGFSLVKPEKWNGKITLTKVELTSPDSTATVKVEALNRVFRTDPSTLDDVLLSLERNLDGFHQIDSQIKLFGKGRQTGSLFVDFTCSQNKMLLRCQQYIVPKRGRSYRISIWAPAESFKDRESEFKAILDSIEL